jgi:hypothetical protein
VEVSRNLRATVVVARAVAVVVAPVVLQVNSNKVRRTVPLPAVDGSVAARTRS